MRNSKEFFIGKRTYLVSVFLLTSKFKKRIKMAYISEWSKRCCFRWAVERPLVGRSRYSPVFYIGGSELHLEFSQNNQTYYLCLKSIYDLDFNVTVHVEDKNRSALPLSSYLKCSKCYDPYVWKYGESDILKAIPDFLTNGIVKFLVSIDTSFEKYKFALQPPIKKIKVDKSVMTEEELIEFSDKSVQKEEAPIQIEEKSVQTPAFIAAARCLEKLSTDFSKLLVQDSRPDVTLACGDLNLGAHRSVLSCRSSVFSEMLSNDTVEGRTGPVQIRDIDSEVFEPFVRYLYTGKLPELTEDKVRRLYEGADKYAVESLQNLCVDFFLEILSPENACEMLARADAHRDLEFKESVLVYILEKEIHLCEDIWLPFCVSRPLLANEV